MTTTRRRRTSPFALRLSVEIVDLNFRIWRELEVLLSAPLHELHETLQVAFGWTNSHLYAFELDGRTYMAPYVEQEDLDDPTLDASAVTLQELGLTKGSRLVYEYDLGDSWRHQIDVVGDDVALPWLFYPRCVGGQRAAPPEDSGGTTGFEDLLAALADPTDEEHESSRIWVGDDYDPLRFDQDAINVRLAAWWGRRSHFAAQTGKRHFAFDQVEWLALADLENEGESPPWLS